MAELAPKMEILKQEEKNLKMAQTLAMLQEKADRATGGGQFAGMSEFGAGGIVAQMRTNAQNRHGATITGLQSQSANLTSQMGALKGVDTTASNFDAGTGVFVGDLTETQKTYNQLKLQQLAIEQQISVETLKQQMLKDVESGAAAMREIEVQKEGLEIAREHVGSINPASAAYHAFVAQKKKEGVEFDEQQLAILQDQFVAMENLKIETELMNGVQDVLKTGFQDMFVAMIDGTKSFKDSMKDLTRNVLMQLAQMFLQAAALKAMMAFFPGMGGAGGFMDFMGLGSGDRYGGERTKGYAHGGIADGPEAGYMAKLHGREAVVPLGNDRSIPVDLAGAMGNIVNVTVNMNGQQSNTSVTGGEGQMQGLGRAIGGLVQQHLQQEMRPGGLLNQQGTKGRT